MIFIADFAQNKGLQWGILGVILLLLLAGLVWVAIQKSAERREKKEHPELWEESSETETDLPELKQDDLSGFYKSAENVEKELLNKEIEKESSPSDLNEAEQTGETENGQKPSDS